MKLVVFIYKQKLDIRKADHLIYTWKQVISEMNLICNKNRDSNFVHINLNAWVTMTLNTWVTWKKMKEKRKDSVGKVSLPVTWHHPWKCFDIVKTGLRKHYHLVAGDFLEQPNYINSFLHFPKLPAQMSVIFDEENRCKQRVRVMSNLCLCDERSKKREISSLSDLWKSNRHKK